MPALSLVSSHLNSNLVFPGGAVGRNNNNFQLRRSAAGGVRRGKPSLGIVKCLNTSILPVLSPEPIIPITSIKRDDFSGDFTFGASTSAIQTEGNLNVDGRGPSTLDGFIKADEGFNATDSYNLYLDDVNALKDMRMSAYRFSISWTRILPTGNLEGGINQKGIEFYNKLIDALIHNGIIPYVTLDHFEIPKALVESYSSFLDKRIIKDFKDYADVCFEKFGDRVKYWKTFNEPYYVGSFMWELDCNPIPEDGAFKATHNLILAHAHVVDLYRTKYKPQQGGEIGISLAFKWIEPFSSTSTEDNVAAQHCIDHEFGWYMDPLYSGEYPKSMRDEIPELPHFTDEERKLVKGSYDFLTLNYYHTYYAKPVKRWIVDPQKGFVHESSIANEGHAEGQQHDKLGNPAGFYAMLSYVKDNYGNPRVVITENGWCAYQVFKTSIQEALAAGNIHEITKALVDEDRLYYIQTHLIALFEAIKDGANVSAKTDIAADAKPTQSELEQLCSTMCSRGLRKYFMTHLSDLNKLRAECPKALKFASDPAKLVLECFGRFFLQGKKAYIRNSPMIMSREVSIFALECFLLMESDGLVIKDKVMEEAETAAVAWRKRLQSEGGLTKACEIDARGLLLLISCFGIPDVFNSEDIKNLIRSSNTKGISGALRRSSFLLARIPEIIEEMLKNKKEIEAVDIVYTFEVQDRFPPQTILSSFLSKSNEIWKRKRKATEDSFAILNEDKKHLAYLKSLVNCLEDNKIDPSKLFPELEINEKISSLEKEITVLDNNVRENMMTKKKANEVESSKRLKTQDVKKHSRFAGHVSQLQKATGEADGNSSYDRLTQVNLNGGILPGHNSYNASPSIPHGSSAGAGLLQEYATVTRAGSGGGLVAAGIGGSISAGAGSFLAPDPYAVSRRSMLVDTDPYNGQLYRWRGDAAANERLISHTYAGQPSSVGYNGLYRPSQSLEGFAGLPDRPSAAVSSGGSTSDLYQFADSVLESELQPNNASRPGGALRPGVPSRHNSSYLY